MVKYDVTKSDPICKWRAVSEQNVIDIVTWLPQRQMSKTDFRNYMDESFDGDFFHTAYQLAVQLALYYEDDTTFYPRFDHVPSIEEAQAYLHKWARLYYVPNPYTKRGFINVTPSINLISGFADYLEDHPSKPNLATAGAALFGGEMGNIGSVKRILNGYSNIIEVDRNNDMKLLAPSKEKVLVYNHRDDKKAFFEHFK